MQLPSVKLNLIYLCRETVLYIIICVVLAVNVYMNFES